MKFFFEINLTELKPAVQNKTRWSGKYLMCDRFLRIREQLIDVANNPEPANMDVPASLSFRNRIEKIRNYLQEINEVTKYLQTHCLSLERCRFALDHLESQIQLHKGTPEASFKLRAYVSVQRNCVWLIWHEHADALLDDGLHYRFGARSNFCALASAGVNDTERLRDRR